MVGDDARCPRQFLFESLLEERNEKDRHDQEDEKNADELHRDHQHDHGRMRPAAVVAVAGGAERLRRPLQAVPDRPMLSFQVGHAELVEQSRDDHE